MSGYKGKESIRIDDFIDWDIDEKIGGGESFDVMKCNCILISFLLPNLLNHTTIFI